MIYLLQVSALSDISFQVFYGNFMLISLLFSVSFTYVDSNLLTFLLLLLLLLLLNFVAFWASLVASVDALRAFAASRLVLGLLTSTITWTH